MTDVATLRDALQELVDRDCTIVGDSIHIPFASHLQAMRALEAAREAYRLVPAALCARCRDTGIVAIGDGYSVDRCPDCRA